MFLKQFQIAVWVVSQLNIFDPVKTAKYKNIFCKYLILLDSNTGETNKMAKTGAYL